MPAVSCAAPSIGIFANDTIDYVSISLSSSMKATFQCLTSSIADISVSDVELQVKDSTGKWKSAKTLTAPPVAKKEK